MKSVRFTRLVLVLPLVLAGMSEAHAGNRSPGRWRWIVCLGTLKPPELFSGDVVAPQTL